MPDLASLRLEYHTAQMHFITCPPGDLGKARRRLRRAADRLGRAMRGEAA